MGRKKNGTSGIVKGASSGLVVSLMVHVGAFLLAGLLVVFTVVNRKEQKFAPPKPVDRPKMKLKKPKVKVKKNAKPKSTTRIVTKIQKADMPDIQLPELGGMGTGLGAGDGIGGFELMPDLDEISVFGGGQSIGNDFEGEVFSLLHTRKGGSHSMGQDEFRDILRKYVLSGWKDSVLAPYYRSPKKLYTTHFMVPPIPTAMAPGAFGVPELEDYYIFVKYKGQLVCNRDIRFRFWAIGDAYLFINVGGREVLMCAWAIHHPWFDWWHSSDAADRTYVLGNMRMVVGDWIDLKAGEPLEMKLLYGEWHGGQVACELLVEEEGVEYPKSRTGGPLLPAFKTEEFTWDQLTQIHRFLAEDECTLTNGPVFNDYYSPAAKKALAEARVPEPEPAPEPAAAPEEPELRVWTMKDGRTLEARFMTAVGGNVVLENGKGRQLKIPRRELCVDDRRFVRLSMPPKLDINFSKTTKPRLFGDTQNGQAPPVRGSFYTFSTSIKQTSVRPYGEPLTAEFFAIGDEIGGPKNILLDYRKAEFTLNRENDFTFEFSGEPVEMLDYIVNDERRGQRYGGYLVVISDSRGKIIAHATANERLFRNLENLRGLKPGWYFDKECNRCLPTPPEPYGNPGLN